jgi:cytidylate kinase
MIISIAGMPGSGKTTIAKLLAQQLDVPRYSVGDLRGKMALERGMTIDELNALGEKEAFTDTEVDDYVKKIGESGEAFVIDGRLAWHFIPHSLKVFLDVDADEAAKRIFSAPREERMDETPLASPAEVKTSIAKRMASDQMRYQKYYNVDFLNRRNYDVVIDTTKMKPEDIVEEILAAARQRRTGT